MEIRALLTIVTLCGCTYVVATADGNHVDTAVKIESESESDIHHLVIFKNNYKHIRQEAARRQLHAELLANTMCAGGFLESKRMEDQVDMLLDEYETPLIEGILHGAIDEVYGCKTPFQLVDLLWTIYQEGDARSFALMLQSQVHLFHSNAKRQHLGDMNFHRKVAFALYKIKQAKLYESVNVNLKQQIDQVISLLPTNLQYLLFYPYFCLMNGNYSEYIYTAMSAGNIDPSSRYIWGWYDTLSIDETGHIKANVFESNVGNNADLLVQLKGTTYDVYYYMMSETKLIAGWELTSEPMNYNWNVEFIDNERVAFYPGDYIMCSTDERTDSERRLVRGYERGNYTWKSGECQWFLGTCNRKLML